MDHRRLSMLASVALAFFVADTTAQALDAGQLALVRDTARGICDTVREAQGSTTSVKVKGDVEAKLKGLSKSIASGGAGLLVEFDRKSYDGISQEAADAIAKAGAKDNAAADRDCRERVFNKMFETIRPKPIDKKAAYESQGRTDDMRSIGTYMRYAPPTVISWPQAAVCDHTENTRYTSAPLVENGIISVSNRDDSNNFRCPSWQPQLEREEEVTCKAPLNQLNDVVEDWSGPALMIHCLSGNCFTCAEITKTKERSKSLWNEKQRTYRIDHVSLNVGGDKYVADDRKRFADLARSFARLISGGTDSALCAARPHLCR